MKKALVDFDGVLLDLCGAVETLLGSKGITFYPENVTKYNFAGDIGCSRSEVFKTFADINLFKCQKFYTGALSSLSKLSSFAEPVAYTTIADVQDLIVYRQNMINDLGLSGTVFTGDKPIINDSDIDAIFEDCLYNLARWSEVEGVKLFLIDQPYNQEINNPEYSSLWEKVIRCKDFEEAVDKYYEMCL